MESGIIQSSSATDIAKLTRQLRKLHGSNSNVWNRLPFPVRALNIVPLQLVSARC